MRMEVLSSDKVVYDSFDTAMMSEMETKWNLLAKAHWWSEEPWEHAAKPKHKLLHVASSSGQSQLEAIYV